VASSRSLPPARLAFALSVCFWGARPPPVPTYKGPRGGVAGWAPRSKASWFQTPGWCCSGLATLHFRMDPFVLYIIAFIWPCLHIFAQSRIERTLAGGGSFWSGRFAGSAFYGEGAFLAPLRHLLAVLWSPPPYGLLVISRAGSQDEAFHEEAFHGEAPHEHGRALSFSATGFPGMALLSFSGPPGWILVEGSFPPRSSSRTFLVFIFSSRGRLCLGTPPVRRFWLSCPLFSFPARPHSLRRRMARLSVFGNMARLAVSQPLGWDLDFLLRVE
jgi:hypothetical protein